MAERKYRIEFFSPRDTAGMARRYEKMAATGWLIESTKGFFHRYRKIQPRQMKFEIVYINTASDYIPADDRQLSFYEICRESGWHLAAKNDKKHIFYSEKADSLPIETDVVTQVENIYRSRRGKVAQLPVMALVMLLNLKTTAGLFRENPRGALDIGLHWFIAGTALYIAAVIADYADRKLWYSKASRIRCEENRFYSKKSSYIFRLYTAAFGLMMFSVLKQFSPAFICVVAVAVLAAYLVYHFMTKLLGHATGSIKENWLPTAWLMVAVIIIVLLLGIELLGTMGISIYAAGQI